MRPYGIMRRTVYLEKGWYKDAIGAMLGRYERNRKRIVALLPGKVSGYSYYDIEAGKRRKITHGNEDLFEKEALAFYKPFPMKKMGIPSLAKYIMETLSGLITDDGSCRTCSDFCGDADTEDQPAYFFGGSAFWKHAAVFCNFGFMCALQ